MAVEIERKYLISNNNWKSKVSKSYLIKQGYLSSNKYRTVRIRQINEEAYITVKGVNTGATRLEYEYKIPQADASDMLKICELPIIEKTRHIIHHQQHIWEIDVFQGVNKGLIVAEVELQSEGEDIVLPNWIGSEVTDDPRYYNAMLIKNPFSEW